MLGSLLYYKFNVINTSIMCFICLARYLIMTCLRIIGWRVATVWSRIFTHQEVWLYRFNLLAEIQGAAMSNVTAETRQVRIYQLTRRLLR